MKEAIAELTRREDKHRKIADTCRTAIRALQDACDHPDTEPDGHDSHRKYVKCTCCGKRW